MARPMHLRTAFLLVMALGLIVVGVFSVIQGERELGMGPGTPLTPVRPQVPSESVRQASLLVANVLEGLRREDVGMPYRIAFSGSEIYVLDAFAIDGIVKVFDVRGNYRRSFGSLTRDNLSFVVDLEIDGSGNVVILDTSPAIHVYSRDGTHIRQIPIDPAFAWARSLLAVGTEFYVLSLDNLLYLDQNGLTLGVYPGEQAAFSLTSFASEFYMGPSGLARDQDCIWISDSVEGRLLKVSPAGNLIREIYLGGAEKERPTYPTSMVVDPRSGDLYVIDSLNMELSRFNQDGTLVWRDSLGRPATAGHPEEVYDLAIAPDGRLFLSDVSTRSIQVFVVDHTGILSREVLLSSQPSFLFPIDVAAKGERVFVLCGEAQVLGGSSYAIHLRESTNSHFSLFADSFVDDPLENPVQLEIYDDKLFVLTMNNILVYDFEGKEVGIIGEDVDGWDGFAAANLFGQIIGPQGMAICPQGRLYVADTFGNRIVVFDKDGSLIGQVALPPDIFPLSLGFSPDRTLVVLNSFEGEVVRIETGTFEDGVSQGNIVSRFASPGTGEGQLGVANDMGRFDGPRGLAIADDGAIYVIDTYNARLVKFSPEGEVIFMGGYFGGGAGEFYLPYGVSVDRKTGMLYVADTYNHRVQVINLP